MKIFKLKPDVRVVEFDRNIHMQYAKDILRFDEMLYEEMKQYRPKYDESDRKPTPNFTYQKYIDEALNDGWRIFMIMLGSTCIGYFHIGSSDYANTAFIGSFIVDKKYRKKGYGRESFDQLKQILKPAFKHMILGVDDNNKYAMNMYAKQGFRPISHMMFADI